MQLKLQNNGKKKQYDTIIGTTEVAIQRGRIDLAQEGRVIDYADRVKLRTKQPRRKHP